MMRSFTAKAIIPIAAAVTGFVAVCCLLLYQAIKNDMVENTIRHETALAATVVKSARHAMLKSDRETLATIIDNVGQQEGVEHIRIFNKKGVVMFSARAAELHRLVDKKAEGCNACHDGPVATATMGTMRQARHFVNERGKNVLAITAPIYNEQDCSSASCHIHPVGQKVLGTLDIGLSQDPLKKTLASLRSKMIIFSLMVLVLTIAGISALLRRKLLLPVKQIAEYAAQVEKGVVTPPPDFHDELGVVGRALHRLAQKARGNNTPPDSGGPTNG